MKVVAPIAVLLLLALPSCSDTSVISEEEEGEDSFTEGFLLSVNGEDLPVVLGEGDDDSSVEVDLGTIQVTEPTCEERYRFNLTLPDASVQTATLTVSTACEFTSSTQIQFTYPVTGEQLTATVWKDQAERWHMQKQFPNWVSLTGGVPILPFGSLYPEPAPDAHFLSSDVE